MKSVASLDVEMTVEERNLIWERATVGSIHQKEEHKGNREKLG